jgi:large subunit ribosomal protein L2
MSIIVKIHNPTSPGRRGLVSVTDTGLHKGGPYAPLLASKKVSGGRNNNGRVTAWQRGGGHKRRYRIIDWKRDKDGIPAKIERFEYDPNRSANLALLLYADGERRYVLAPKGAEVGMAVASGPEAAIALGNCLPIRNIPVGSVISCIELKTGKGAQLARSAGAAVQLLAREGNYATIRFRNGEMRKVHVECRAVVGEVGNSEHNLRKLGKAGRARWLNRRPHVRGVAMNPVDHPLGGGEGRTSGGRHPCTPWGVLEIKTRRNKRTDKFIIRRRKSRVEG